MFAQAFPPGAQLLPVTAPAGPTKVWATPAPTGVSASTLINQDTLDEHDVAVQLPHAIAPGARSSRCGRRAITATPG